MLDFVLSLLANQFFSINQKSASLKLIVVIKVAISV